MTVRIDFHVHTRWSLDSGIEPGRLVTIAEQRGLDAIAVCDHGRIDGALATRDIASHRAGALNVIVGEEVRSSEGEIIGLFLQEQIPNGLSPEATIGRIREQHGVVVVPHPFDRHRRSGLAPAALERVATLVDAVEGLNARNLNGNDDRTAVSWARDLGLTMVAGSDAHTYGEIGRAWTELPSLPHAEDFRAVVREGRLCGRRSWPWVHVPTAVRKRTPLLGSRTTHEAGSG